MKKYFTPYLVVITFFTMCISCFSVSEFRITTLNNPAPGVLSFNLGAVDNIKLIDNYGNNLSPNKIVTGSSLHKKLKNGLWISMSGNKYRLYNDNQDFVDSIPNPTNYSLDFHEVELLSNGHYLLLLRETVVVDLSDKIEGGNTNANLIVNVLVETDRTGQIYWQWKILDHIEVTDVTDDINLTDNFIDLTHINSIFEDTDGNIIISIRNFDEIAKINKSTGNFIWRMGGSKSKKNQFTFLNDTKDGFFGFSHQHTVSVLENGNILLFDNGNLKPIQYSRAVEYSVDYTQKTVSKVWEFRKSPDYYQQSMGSAFRLSNGNTLINWSQGSIQEVKPDKTIALEVAIDKDMIYRVQKVASQMSLVSKDVIDIAQFNFMDEIHNTGVQLAVQAKTGSGKLHLQKYNYSPQVAMFNDSSFTSVFPYRWVLSSDAISEISGKIYFNTNLINGLNDSQSITVYKRSKETDGIFIKLNTNFDSYSKEIYADFSGMGEFVLVSNKLGKPVLINPINHKVEKPNGKLEWEPTIGATSYQIQLSKSNSFDKTILNMFTADKITYFNYTNLLRIDSIYWKVRAINYKDTSAWSNIGRFTTVLPAPKLLSPYKDTLNLGTELDLNCNSILGASSYLFEISTNQEFNQNLKSYLVDENVLNLKNLYYNQKYFWRVKSVRSTDSSNWSEVWNFTTLLKTPDLISPAKKAINVVPNPIILWNKTEDDFTYHLQISMNNTFNKIIIDTNNLIQNSIKCEELQPNTTYFWRLRVIRTNQFSDWSDIWSFTTGNGFELAKPSLISPKNNTENYIAGIMKWIKVINAIKYNLQISLADDLSQKIIDTIIEDKVEYTYKNLNYSTKYAWRVKAMSVYSESKWSDYSYLNTSSKRDYVQLATPLNDDIQVTVNGKLEWYEITNVDNYLLQLAEDSEFKNIIINSSSLNTNFYYFTALNKFTKYYWRVKYVENNTESKWSETWYFTTESENSISKPELSFPENNAIAVKTNVSLSWAKVYSAEKYQISVSKNSDFSNILYSVNDLTDTFFVINNLEYNQRYFWRVACSNINAHSTWTEINTFVSELKKPGILTPANNSTYNPNEVEFKWTYSEFNQYFTLQISTDKNFIEDVMELVNIETNFVTIPLLPSKHYYFRLKALGDNNESNWTETVEFNTKSEVSVDDNFILDKIDFYPNPCVDYLNIKFESSENMTYEILNISGIQLQNGYLKDNIINTKNLENGIYFIRINNQYFQFVKFN